MGFGTLDGDSRRSFFRGVRLWMSMEYGVRSTLYRVRSIKYSTLWMWYYAFFFSFFFSFFSSFLILGSTIWNTISYSGRNNSLEKSSVYQQTSSRVYPCNAMRGPWSRPCPRPRQSTLLWTSKVLLLRTRWSIKKQGDLRGWFLHDDDQHHHHLFHEIFYYYFISIIIDQRAMGLVARVYEA